MKVSSRGQKTICIPVDSEMTYGEILEDLDQFRAYLEQAVQLHPEIFPPNIQQGYRFYGLIYSKKCQLKLRRIQLLASGEVYQLRPDFLMPYMIGKTDEVEKGLYLRRYGVPYDALAYAFGHSAMYWYRAEQTLGKFSVVGTTVKSPTQIPGNLVADEKHSWLLGERVYLTTTVGDECFLGVEGVKSASTDDLEAGYTVFRDEALNLNPDYHPETVNTDGWQETQAAWRRLFPSLTLILCFLHSVLGIQAFLKRCPEQLQAITRKLWHLYHAQTKAQFAQRLRRLQDWATVEHIASDRVREKLTKLRANSAKFQVAYDHPEAHRTSNALDRLMNHQDRYLYGMKYFHGTMESASIQMRAMALLWNFHPYGSRTQLKGGERSSPFGQLNGFVYHQNWLHNLLIAGSMNGYVPRDEKLNRIS